MRPVFRRIRSIDSDDVSRRAWRRAIMRGCLAVALCALVAVIMVGCRDSDSYVEYIQDQQASYIDHENPVKYYVPDDSSDIYVDDLTLTVDESQQLDDAIQDKATYGEGDSDQQVDKTQYADEAAESEESAPTPVASSTGQVESDQTTGSGGDQASQGTMTSAQVQAGQGEGTGTGSGGDGNQGESTVTPDNGTGPAKNNGDSGNEAYNGNGDLEDLPKDARTIVASGEAATIALMVGGQGTLVGTSQSYLSDAAHQKVFASRGIADAKAVWSGEGSTTSDADLQAIIDLKPDACVVFAGQMTSAQISTLSDAGIKVVYTPELTCDANIRTAVKIMGTLLSEKTGNASMDVTNAYLGYIDRVIEAAEAKHGGGVVTYNGVDYSNPDTTKTTTASNVSSYQLWTLYISSWDTDAHATASYYGSEVFSDTGVGYTQCGWTWSPLSYYMSAGGVINNAAAYGGITTQIKHLVLCYNENEVVYTWSGLDIPVGSDAGGSFEARGYWVLTNARDAVDSSTNASQTIHPLGSDDFYSVIVKTKDIANKLKASKTNGCGLYTTYGLATTSSGSGYGLRHEGGMGESIIYTTVLGDRTYDGQKGYQVIVNPCGMVGSWTDGSVESPLESLWIAATYWGYDANNLRESVSRFYQTFYGYTPSSTELDQILSGDFATGD